MAKHELEPLDIEPLTLGRLQREQAEWAARNFGEQVPAELAFLGIVEEVGELAHAILKGLQGIRGSSEDHAAAAKDAVGDTIIYLADFCTRSGYDLEEIVMDTWAQVKARDWTRHKANGVTG